MEGVLIRKLRPEDAEAIETIFREITQEPVVPEFKNLVRQHATVEDGACFAAELDGKVVGFMISYILTMGFGITKSAWIATLGVSPKHMGQGIGESLAREVFDLYQSEGVNQVFTSVRWDSTDLLSFFKTLGFDRSNFINLKKSIE